MYLQYHWLIPLSWFRFVMLVPCNLARFLDGLPFKFTLHFLWIHLTPSKLLLYKAPKIHREFKKVPTLINS